MKNYLFILIVLFVCVVDVAAQNYSELFGKISKEEVDMTSVSWDPSAEAVVLFDYGTSYFVEPGDRFEIVFDRITRIKIFNEAGMDYANVEIPFYSDKDGYEKVKNIKVNVYNIENGVVKKNTVEDVSYFDEKINQNWTLRKFAIPNVKAGSIIEYKYSLQSTYFSNLQDWNFQWRIPVLYSEYVAKLVPFYEYQFVVQGVRKLDVMESYEDGGIERQFGPQKFKDMVNRYALKNIPAFRDEEFVTSINDYLIKIDFQLYQIHTLSGAHIKVVTTWPELIKEFIKDSRFGKYIDKSESVASKIPNIKDLLLKSQKERFDFAVNYVKNNFKWDGNNSKFAYNTVNQLIDKKQGNSAEINLFLIGLLHALKIDALPVISSTRQHGKIKYDIPFYDYFNYVTALVNVEGKNFLVDGTELSCPNERIPFRCINDKGLIIKKDNVSWIGLQSTIPSIIETTIKTTVTDSVTKSHITSSSTEYDAIFNRAKYGDDTKKLLSDLNKKGYDIIDESVDISNSSDINLPYIINFDCLNKTGKIGNKIYVIPFLAEAITENPLKQLKSTYPVDMSFPKKRVYTVTISIPDTYKIESVGKNLEFKNELYTIDYSSELVGNQINIKMIYEFEKSIYPSEDYDKLQYYFDEIIGKIKEQVVLVKM